MRWVSYTPKNLSDDHPHKFSDGSNTGTIPRLGFAGLCLEDSPLGVRFADYASAFPAGINAAMSWDRDLILARGVAMVSFSKRPPLPQRHF